LFQKFIFSVFFVFGMEAKCSLQMFGGYDIVSSYLEHVYMRRHECPLDALPTSVFLKDVHLIKLL